MTRTIDLVVYSGSINMRGYHAVCDAIKAKKSEKVLLVLGTSGGDPNAGFRIARALQHAYGDFDALVPRYCKSAGTLVLIGARTLYLDDMSELGPLDIQVKKGDELIGRNSGLDIFQAVNYLQNQSLSAFRECLLELTRDAGLSTRVASDIACRLTSGLFEPIAAQIDPIKLAEMQRATEIAFEYGNRLNEKSRNMRDTGLAKLVSGYPSHGFVIDRKEAKTLFINVKRPEGLLAQWSGALRDGMEAEIDAQAPKVQLLSVDNFEQEPPSDNPSNAQGGASSAETGEQPVVGDCPDIAPAEAGAADSSVGAAQVDRHAPDSEPASIAAG